MDFDLSDASVGLEDSLLLLRVGAVGVLVGVVGTFSYRVGFST